MKLLLDLLFPKKCVGCGKFGRYVCDTCQVGLWEEVQLRPQNIDGLTCLWAYDGLAKKIIQKAKYKLQYDLLSELIVDNGQWTMDQKFDVIVPVPLHETRLKERGFNQAEIIAEILAKNLKFKIKNLLIRVKDTGHQTLRNRNQRIAAMKGAFQISNSSLSRFASKFQIPEAVLLVDDVWTTGATMGECCNVLKKAGVKKVWGLVLAR